jgi:hypothetical protein
MTTPRRTAALLPGIIAGLVFVLITFGAPSAGAYHTNFQGYCNFDWYNIGAMPRYESQSYAYIAVNEGYQWGGGCWNNNDNDDSPGDPPGEYTNGEGGDCSGFTFKSWYERAETDDPGFRYHDRMQNVHGPFSTYTFMSESENGPANELIPKSWVLEMDAFVSGPHMGMVFTPNTAYNTDQIIEAKGEAYGTGIWSRTYRGDPDFIAVRRVGWASW